MEGAFAWLSDLIGWFGKFFPNYRIVRATHGAVKFIRGRVVHCPPGFYVYWPVTTEWDTYPIARQAVVLRPQTLTTSDQKTIVIGCVLSYRVVDVLACLTKMFCPDETIEEISLGIANRVIASKTWQELQESHRSGALDAELKREARKALRQYGVSVLSASITDLAPCKVLKLMTGAKGLQL